jgi:O-methyltransferase
LNGRLDRARTLAKLTARAVLSRDREATSSVRHLLASKVASWLGDYQLYKHTHAWLDDREFLQIWQTFPEGDDKIRDRRFSLYQLARSTENLSGDTAECGVWRGAGSYLICKATEAPGRTHHVFDSFEGLAEATTVDFSAKADRHEWKPGEFATPMSVVERNLAGTNSRLYRGWIPDRFAEVADREFVFVHVNVDLYEATLKSLEFFYPRLVRGGLLVCHDYGFVNAPGAKAAFDEFAANNPERHVIHLTSGQGFIVKR